MRIAVISDIHANLTAFKAVLRDLDETAPDLILHGGDLADGGSSPVEVLDRIRDLGWPGVIGNTDEMLAIPATLEAFAQQSTGIQPFLPAIRKMAVATRQRLGPERLAWLGSLPRSRIREPLVLVHAGPDDPWRGPKVDASEDELRSVYSSLGQPIVVYGHIHQAFIRKIGELTVANSGSVGMPYDGDPRASYLLLEDGVPTIRRVEYNLDRELRLLSASGLPHADWIARTLKAARPQMP